MKTILVDKENPAPALSGDAIVVLGQMGDITSIFPEDDAIEVQLMDEGAEVLRVRPEAISAEWAQVEDSSTSHYSFSNLLFDLNNFRTKYNVDTNLPVHFVLVGEAGDPILNLHLTEFARARATARNGEEHDIVLIEMKADMEEVRHRMAALMMQKMLDEVKEESH